MSKRPIKTVQTSLAAMKQFGWLANLTAGVLVFDAGMRLATANQGAEAILAIDAQKAQWQPLAELRVDGGAARIGRYIAEHQSMGLLNLRSANRAVAGGEPGPEGAMTKLVLSEIGLGLEHVQPGAGQPAAVGIVGSLPSARILPTPDN